MRDSTSKLLRILFVPLWMGIGATLLWLLVRQLELDKLQQELAHVAAGPLLLAIALDVVAVLCKATKWHLLLRPLSRISVLRLQGAIYAGGAVSVVLPFRLDEGVRAYAAARMSGLRWAQVIGSMALERLVDLFVIGVVVLALLVMLPLPAWFSGTLLVVGVLSAVIIGMLVLSHLFSSARWIPPRLTRFIESMAEGSRALARPHLLSGATLLALCEWALTVTLAALVSHAVGLSLPYDALILTTTLLFASFAIPMVPAGIGPFEWAVTESLHKLYGATRVQAATMAMVMHALLLAPMVTVGTLIIVITGIRLRDVQRWRKEDSDSESESESESGSDSGSGSESESESDSGSESESESESGSGSEVL